MAKKRFTDNLSGLFEPAAPRPEDQRPAEPAHPAAPAAGEETMEVKVPARSTRAKRRLSSKGFTADLDAFLSDSFERESNPRPASADHPSAPATAPTPAGGSTTNHPPPRSRRRKTGLDLLIRSTVSDEDRGARDQHTADTKRVTLIFKKDHLAELKEQAKQRGMYLKDVVQEMVAKYLEE